MKRAKSVLKKVGARRAESYDFEVGRRVRSRRLECGLSQTDLANKVGVSFQQVQKYEKGTNRISSGRLHHIAAALDVPITFFFDAPAHMSGKSARDPASVFELMQDPSAIRLVKAFNRIKSPDARQALVSLAEKLG